MVNRPKAIGTAAETAVTRAARRLGFPNADRLPLSGALDRGDVGLCPGVILEVKGGGVAKNATDGAITRWLAETYIERSNADADIGLLVTQRAGVGAPNAHRWWAWWRLGDLTDLTGGDAEAVASATQAPVRMTLDDALTIIRNAGYGNPIEAPNRPEPIDAGRSVEVP